MTSIFKNATELNIRRRWQGQYTYYLNAKNAIKKTNGLQLQVLFK